MQGTSSSRKSMSIYSDDLGVNYTSNFSTLAGTRRLTEFLHLVLEAIDLLL